MSEIPTKDAFIMMPIEPVYLDELTTDQPVTVAPSRDGNISFATPGEGFAFRVSPQQIRDMYEWLKTWEYI